MSDPFLILTRLLSIVLVPAMLLFPLVTALIVPSRVRSDTDRAVVRVRLLTLAFVSLAALLLWLGLFYLYAFLPGSALGPIVNFTWILFFPLWFFLAMPAIRAKNPVTASASEGVTASTEGVRVASLKNRQRENPIGGKLRWLPVAILLLAVLAVSIRGIFPFVDLHWEGEGEMMRERWIFLTTLMLIVGIPAAIIIPVALRRLGDEPEPLDPKGSSELIELYRGQRRRRSLGLFWLIGVGLPAFVGAILAAMVWMPSDDSTIGLIGALGGSAIGVAGAVFGIMMTIERVRIAEVKARLDAGS
jgi:hypothetical protein